VTKTQADGVRTPTNRLLRWLMGFALASEIVTASGVAFSQETGRLVIAVRDARTGAPLPLVRVTISGNAVLIGYSDSAGNVRFEDVPPGVYSGTARKAGYALIDIPSFETRLGQEIAIAVKLSPVSALKTIGSVIVHARAISAANTVQSSGATRILAGSLTEALNMLPGVQGPTNEFGPGSSLGVSIDGQGSSDTGFTFEGLPLGALGGGGSLRGVSSDLFAGAAVERSSKNGAQGGTINFFGFNPTIAWQESLESAYGSYDSHRAIITARGSVGRLGLAVVHSYRYSSSPLNDEFYVDSSGSGYIHDAASNSDGTYLRARYPFSVDHVATATMIWENSRQPFTCFYFTGPVPCGYGPGNYSTTRSTDLMFNDSFALHNATVSIQALVNGERFIDDDRRRLIAGTLSPFYQDSAALTRGLSLNVQLPQSGRNSVSFNASDYVSSVQLESPFAGRYPAFSQSAFVHYGTASLSDTYHPDTKTLVAGAFGTNQANGSGTSPFASLMLQRSFGRNDTVSGSYEVGTLAAVSQPLGEVLDPQSLLFNCAAGIGFGAAGGTAQASQSSTSATLAWQHRFGESSINVDMYRRLRRGEPFTVLVNGNALPLSAFPPTYFVDASSLFSSESGCGRTAMLAPADLYFYDSVAGINRVYEGVHATATLALGGRLTLQPSYVINAARITAGPADLLSSGTDITIGGQIPGVPLHSESLLADYRISERAEILAAMQHVDANNQNNLQAYTIVSLAARIDTLHGALIGSVTNLFDQEAGNFITNYGVPLRSSTGFSIPTFAIPLAPRTFSLTYNVQIGTGANAAAPPPATSPEQNFSFNPRPLPSSRPANALAVNTGSPTCTPELLGVARAQLVALSRYVQSIEDARKHGAYPPVYAPLHTGRISAFFHPFANSYALEVQFNLSDPVGQRTFGAVLSCSDVAFGTREQIVAHDGYLPAEAAPGKSYLIYQPSLGLYIYLNQQETAQSQIRLFAIPTQPPTHPFAIDSTRCLSEFRPLAEQLLTSLAGYVAAYRTTGSGTPQPSGWHIIPHAAHAGFWLELAPTDPYGIQAVESCGHVSQGTGAQIHARGLDARNGIDLNFAPQLGIYAREDTTP
jgi:hypothetical protein